MPTLVVAPRPEDARRLHEQLLAWCGDDEGLLHFPESEILPFERLDSDVETVHQRLRVLAAVASTVSDMTGMYRMGRIRRAITLTPSASSGQALAFSHRGGREMG